MTRLVLAVLIFLLALGSAQASGVYSDIVESFKSQDAVAEITVISAELNTYKFNGTDRVCGSSYVFHINQVLVGRLGNVQSLGSKAGAKDGRELRGLDGGMQVGGTYLVGIDQSGKYRDERSGFDFLTGERESPAYARCLESMPSGRIGASLEVFRASSSFPNGMPNDGREYLKVFSTRSLDPTAIFGALNERYYSKEDVIDSKARSYLSDDGIYPPADAKRAYAANAYMKDIGRNGDYDFYQVTVSYDAFKHFILDPNYKPVYRLN